MHGTKVPFYGVAREFAAYRDEYMSLIEETMVSGQMLQGRAVQELEEQVAAICHREHAVAVNSCTDALFFALLAIGVQPGDEVLVPDFTFAASASCILRAGAKPVFVDINDEMVMDLEKAATLVTKNTKAMIFVHLFGRMSDPAPIEDFARSHNLVLIEDSAQVLGASYGPWSGGSIGKASCISFDPTKVVSAPGSGGILLTDDAELAGHVERLRYHGKSGAEGFVHLGYNSQMPCTTAALLSAKFRHAAEWAERRREIAGHYIDGLRHISSLELPTRSEGASHIYHKFVLKSDERNGLKSWLGEAGIEVAIHYSQPLHREPMFAGVDADDRDFPNSIRLSESVLSLPIHPFLTDEEIKRVVYSIADFYGST